MNFTKLKSAFPNAVTSKTTTATTLMNFLDLPSDIKSFLLSKFTDEEGKLNAYKLSEYIKEMRLKPQDWNVKLLEARHSAKGTIKLLTKIKVEFDYANDLICFSLPEYGFPKKRGEAQVEWSLVSHFKKSLLDSNGTWGEITLIYDCGIIRLAEFSPLCPYTFDLTEYQLGRMEFTTEEWIDVLISGLNFNPNGFNKEQKLILLQRFLPFVEKRLNQIELAIKGSAKSYCYSQLSVHNWMTSGIISRATAFYNNTTKQVGYFSKYDNVIWDEVQTIKCSNDNEMNGILKPYLESGEIRIGEYCGMSDAGLTLVGNIPIHLMNPEKFNMFANLPRMFRESAFLDRFSGIIEGWKIGRFDESRKAEGWALNATYLTGMFHELREEFYYRAIVDDILEIDGGDTRNFEAIKKSCTAYLKLLFPHVTTVEEINIKEFREYCLNPAIKLRENVLKQLRIIDTEYENIKMPTIKIKGE